MTGPGTDLQILFVEDDDIDVIALQRAMEATGISLSVTRVRDGVEALAVLRGSNGSAPLRRPYIVLVDINLPRMNGIEFLAELRRDPELQSTVVFTVTTSQDAADKKAAYRMNVAGFLGKSATGCFADIVSLLGAYAKTVDLP